MANESDLAKKKRETISELISTEEDVIADLGMLVKKAKNLIQIDGNTGRTIVNIFGYTQPEKILLVLIGRFFAYHAGLVQPKPMNLSAISSELGIPPTTLSAPLGKLVEDGLVNRTARGEYEVVSQHIKIFLDVVRKKNGLSSV